MDHLYISFASKDEAMLPRDQPSPLPTPSPSPSRPAAEETMSPTREELISRLHCVGHLYWQRNDTADCTVKVFRLSSSQQRRYCQQCLNSTNRLPSQKRPLEAGSVATSAPPTRLRFRDDETPAKRSKLAATLPSRCSERPMCRSSASMPILPQPSPRSPTLSYGDLRRDSAPPNFKAENDPCSRCRPPDQTSTHHLHKDFLVTQSDTFQKIFEGGQAVVELALPDPSSFEALVKYFYMGNFAELASAMESGQVRWENIMLNARHLGFSQGLKMRLGAWWRHRQGRPVGAALQQQREHRGSLPAKALGPILRSRLDIGRPRARTLGSRQEPGQSSSESDKLSPMMQVNRRSGTLASGMTCTIAGEDSDLRGERSKDRDCHPSIPTHKPGRFSSRLSGDTPSSSASMSPPAIRRSLAAPSPTPLPTSPRFPHDILLEKSVEVRTTSPERSRATTDDQDEREAARRPSAVRQLLLSGKRRRALSSLAYYCSIDTQVGKSNLAPVHP